MVEDLKVYANKLVDKVCRKVRRVCKTDFYRFGSTVGIGADGTVTKYIDKVTEDAALDFIRKEKLKVNVLSEEIGFVDNGGKFTFVLDPIDGTRNAYRGIPFYSVSLAIGRKNLSDVFYGVVKNIPTGDVFIGEKGGGAFLNNKQVYVPEFPDSELLSSLSLGNNYDRFTLRHAKKDKVRSLGAASLEMCMVAIGALDFYLIGKEYLRVIDIAASTLILREAGGVVTNVFGEELDIPLTLDDRTSVVAACNMDLVKDIIKK